MLLGVAYRRLDWVIEARNVIGSIRLLVRNADIILRPCDPTLVVMKLYGDKVLGKTLLVLIISFTHCPRTTVHFTASNIVHITTSSHHRPDNNPTTHLQTYPDDRSQSTIRSRPGHSSNATRVLMQNFTVLLLSVADCALWTVFVPPAFR